MCSNIFLCTTGPLALKVFLVERAIFLLKNILARCYILQDYILKDLVK